MKSAILHTLGLLIGKAGTGLKPFVPQLQTTFLKCLGDQVLPLSSQIFWHSFAIKQNDSLIKQLECSPKCSI